MKRTLRWWLIASLVLGLGLISVSAMAQQKAVFRSLSGWDMPPAYNGNPFAPGGVGGAKDYTQGRMFDLNVIDGTYTPWLATDFSETSTALTVHLRKDLTWDDGVKFTSKDVLTEFYVGGAINTWKEVWQYVDKIETPDDYTVVFYWAPQKSILAKTFIFDKFIQAPYHIYGTWLKDAQEIVNLRKQMWAKEAAGQDVSELKAALDAKYQPFRKSLRAFKPAMPVGVGPFKLEKVTPSQMVLVKRSDTPWAKTMLIDEVQLSRYTTNELAWSMFMAGEVDLEKPAAPPNVVEALIKANPKLKMILVPDFSTACVVMNEKKYPFSEKAFRQALAYVINRDKVRETALYYGSTVEYLTGLLPSALSSWTTSDFRASLNPYPVDYAKATKLLEGLGMVKGSDGFWMTKDGKKLDFGLIARQGYSDWIVAAQEISQELTSFGIKTSVRIVPGQLYGSTLIGGDYDMAIAFGSFAKFHPVQAYDRLYSTGFIARISGFDPKGKGPNGEDLDKLVQELYVTNDRAEQKALIEKLAKATNEYLPVIEYVEKRSQFFLLDGVRVTGWPAYTKSATQPNVWLPGKEMLNQFGYDWRWASLNWMANGILKPVTK